MHFARPLFAYCEQSQSPVRSGLRASNTHILANGVLEAIVTSRQGRQIEEIAGQNDLNDVWHRVSAELFSLKQKQIRENSRNDSNFP